jgi:hypothetical protein
MAGYQEAAATPELAVFNHGIHLRLRPKKGELAPDLALDCFGLPIALVGGFIKPEDARHWAG